MPSHDSRIDAYSECAAPFARRSCTTSARSSTRPVPMSRRRSNGACRPSCMPAACSAAWRRSSGMPRSGFGSTPPSSVQPASASAWGSFGKLASIEDLPPRRTLLALIRKAARLNEAGVKAAPAPRTPAAAASDLLSARGAGGMGDVRGVQPEPAARVRPTGARGHVRGDAPTPHRRGRHVARRGKARHWKHHGG